MGKNRKKGFPPKSSELTEVSKQIRKLDFSGNLRDLDKEEYYSKVIVDINETLKKTNKKLPGSPSEENHNNLLLLMYCIDDIKKEFIDKRRRDVLINYVFNAQYYLIYLSDYIDEKRK